MPARLTASLLALAAFALAIVMGIAADNPAVTTLSRALIAMACCYGVGYVVGWMGHRAAHEHVERYQRQHPVPTLEEELESHVSAASENAADQISQDAPGLRPRSSAQAA